MASGSEMVVRSVNAGTGEIAPVPSHPNLPGEAPLALRDETWSGKLKCTKAQDALLRGKLKDSEVDILPSGEVYMSHVHVRRRLNDAFMTAGGWKLRPMSNVSIDPDTHVMYREYALVVDGIAVAAAYGANKYQPKNARMDFADCAEAVRSNALTRCAKDLGIGSECWDRDWCEAWKEKHAVHVVVNARQWDARRNEFETKPTPQWRKITRRPFVGEIDIVADSPNFEKWQKQIEGFREMLRKRNREAGKPAPRFEEPDPRGGESATARARQPEVVEEPRREQPRSQAQTGKAEPLRVPESERGFYIRAIRVSREQHKPHQIEMMDGFIYYTFHKSHLPPMQQIWAKRQRVKIDYENKASGGRTYPHITEWRVG